MDQEPNQKKHCIICESDFDEFRPFASRRRMVQCPVCKSIDRNRLVFAYLTNETDLFSEAAERASRPKILHIAPEKVLGKLLSQMENVDYYPVDIDPSRPLVREAMDIQNIHYPDNSFDYILCSHVLEHIPDDRKAMRQMARVLRQGGQALILVPLQGETTIEDPAYNTDELRRLHYGGVEHVRFYGMDIVDRLTAAGFSVDPLRYSDRFSPEDISRLALARERIFVCRRPLDKNYATVTKLSCFAHSQRDGQLFVMEGLMQGFVEKISTTHAFGWAYDEATAEPAQIRVSLDGKTLVEGVADQAKANLKDPEGEPVQRGYRLEFPAIDAARAKEVVVKAKTADGWVQLPFSKGLMRHFAGKRSNKKAYQDFDGKGSSKSNQKLEKLRLDRINGGDLTGMAVLDIGCNEGFFCRAALQAGATRVVGIDSNKVRLESAKERVPGAEFLKKRWSHLPNEKFDLIFFLSAIHYEKDQKTLLRNILLRLNPGGTLILECGIADVAEEKWFKTAGRRSWHTVMRHDGLKRYPTYDMLTRELLTDYSVRLIGKSVKKGGDPVPRWVLHCSPKQPTAILISADSNAGKTNLSLSFDSAGIPSFRLDPLLAALVRDERYAWSGMSKTLKEKIDTNSPLSIKKVVDVLIAEGLDDQLASLVWDEIPREADQFIIEGEALCRPQFRDKLVQKLKEGGVRPWLMQPIET